MLTVRNPTKTLVKSLKGTAYHVGAWLTSRNHDVVYRNPRFTKECAAALEGTEWENGVGVFYIHGTADRVDAFDYFAQQHLRDLPELIASLHLLSFDSRGRGLGIMDFAKQLLQKIRASGIRKIFLFGHSRGGLVGAALSYLAKEYGIEILGLFTLGTPFGGSDLALAPIAWLSKSVLEMQRGSDFLKKLNRQILESTIPCVHYAGSADELVNFDSSYVQSKFLDEAEQKQFDTVELQAKHLPFLLPHHSHLSMTYSLTAANHSLRRMHQLTPKLVALKSLPVRDYSYLDQKALDPQLDAEYFPAAGDHHLEIDKETPDAKDADEFVWVDSEKFALVDKNDNPVLAQLCCDLDCHIMSLSQKKSPALLLMILSALKCMFLDMLESQQPCAVAPHAKTIGECILECILKLNKQQSTSPIDLKHSPNYTPAFFEESVSAHPVLMELFGKYRDKPVPTFTGKTSGISIELA